MEVLHNNTITELNGMSSAELEAYYTKNPFKYYQQYVAGSISPYYDVRLAALGCAEEFLEFLTTDPAVNKEDFISELGDFLFQLCNVANFKHIDLSDIEVTMPNTDPEVTIAHFMDANNKTDLYKMCGKLFGTIMKEARYPDKSMFEAKYGMTLEAMVEKLIRSIIDYIKQLVMPYGILLKDIMDYNLKKLDERHSVDGKWTFGSGYANTLSNGGTVNR